MRTFEEWCFRLWSAAYFIRRAPLRDHSSAWRVIDDIITNGPHPINDRAWVVKKEQEQ